MLDHIHGQARVDPALRVVVPTMLAAMITKTLLTQRRLHDQTDMVRYCASSLASRRVLSLTGKVPVPLLTVAPTRGSFRDPRFRNPGQASSWRGGTPLMVLLRAHLWLEIARRRRRGLLPRP